MLPSSEQLVQQIHDAAMRLVLVVAGGGSRAVAELLDVPGSSRTLLEAVVPYSAQALVDWLRGRPDESCSAATARAMAVAAFARARRLEEAGKATVGVACTASLATDRPKRGAHRIHVALQTASATASWRLTLQKDRRTRAEEERLAGQLILNVIAEACGLAARLPLELVEGEAVEHSRTEAPAAWQDLLLGKVEVARGKGSGFRVQGSGVGDQGAEEGEADRGPCCLGVLSGAFNPLHGGHRRMAEAARKMLGRPVAFELSIENVDKPPLDYMEIERRVGQFLPTEAVYLTRATTFEEKSRLFPGATFLVGVDTLARIASVEYYGGSAAAREESIGRIAGRGCRFLVFGRDFGKSFIRLSDIELPDSLAALCREVPSKVFREDVSSTAIRRSQSEPG